MVAHMMIDFNQMNQNWPQRRIGKQHDVCRAVGLHRYTNLQIADATAGLARDAFIFAKLGANVTMIERHPAIAAAIQEALDTCEDIDLKSRLQFYHHDSREFLTQSDYYDVIYLDPMFPSDNRTALAKKDLQTLQAIVGHDSDSDELLHLAKHKARKRVVVKRHKYTPYLDAQTPSLSINGSSMRYDIYLMQTS